MRAAFAALFFLGLKWQLNLQQPNPNGLAHLGDLTFLAKLPVWWQGRGPVLGSLAFGPLQGLMLAGLALYISGRLPALGLALSLLVAVPMGTLINSQGAISHYTQLLCLIALAQMLVYLLRSAGAAMAVALLLGLSLNRLAAWGAQDWRIWLLPLIALGMVLKQLRPLPRVWRPTWEGHIQAVHAAKVVVVVSYTASGLMKLINSKLMWIRDVPNIGVQIMKGHYSDYYSDLEQDSGMASALAQVPVWIAEHPHLTRLFFSGGLFLELFCLVALQGRLPGFLWALALITMHFAVSLIMALEFQNHAWALFIFFICPLLFLLFQKKPRQ